MAKQKTMFSEFGQNLLPETRQELLGKTKRVSCIISPVCCNKSHTVMLSCQDISREQSTASTPEQQVPTPTPISLQPTSAFSEQHTVTTSQQLVHTANTSQQLPPASSDQHTPTTSLTTLHHQQSISPQHPPPQSVVIPLLPLTSKPKTFFEVKEQLSTRRKLWKSQDEKTHTDDQNTTSATYRQSFRDQQSEFRTQPTLRERQRMRGSSVQIALLVGTILLLIFQQIYFSGTWERECDYDLKVRCTIWVVRFIVYYALLVFQAQIAIKYGTNSNLFKRLTYVKYILNLFNLIYFLVGIKSALFGEKCDSMTATWGQVLWWFEIIVKVCPVVFVFPCLIYYWLFVAQEEPVEDIREQLEVLQYKAIKDNCELQQMEHFQQSKGASSKRFESRSLNTSREAEEPLNPVSNVTAALTGIVLPSISQFKRLRTGVQSFGRRSPFTSIGAMTTSACCPICVAPFEDEEYIVRLPCNTSHIFHKDCVFSWLEDSQQCPVCRSNVVAILKNSGGDND